MAATAGLARQGTRIAVADDLRPLLSLAAQDDPGLSTLEDFMPEDPRDVVEIEFNGRLYRLIGGSVERPVADLERLLTISAAADSHLEAHLGFGLRHLAEVALTHLDSVLRQSKRQPHSEHGIGDASISFSQDELVLEPDERQWTGPHAAALEWATVDAAALAYDPSSPVSSFGNALRVKFRDEVEPRWLTVDRKSVV